MKITILTENHSLDPDIAFEHGLSVYAETEKHRVLMDSGQTGVFAYNAVRLGADLKAVDTAVLSHGHYDHAGGLRTFAVINPEAPIYMQRGAVRNFHHGDRYIGIDPKIPHLKQVRLLDGDYRIDEELFLFSGIRGRRFWPQSNLSLSVREGGMDTQDDFSHEQCLVIASEGQNVLLSGCAHNGILNILDRYREIFASDPDVVISGFHMMKKDSYTKEESETIIETARELARTDTVFYTGHCTGQQALELMKPIMGEKLVEISAGMSFDIL